MPITLKVPDQDDEGLMRRVQDNDSLAFAQLYDRHAARGFVVALSVSHDIGLAEEALQEGFLSIWRGRASYSPGAGASFRGWAMTTIRNRAIDSHRRQASLKHPKTSAVAAEDLPKAASRSVLDEVMERSDQRELSDHLERLPETQAEVITLAYFGGLSHTEIAEQLGLPHGTVKGRMRLGLEKLRRGMSASD